MANYNNPYKTLIAVQASIDPTLAFQIPPPTDFYDGSGLWKLTIAGTTTLPSGGGFIRRIVEIGDTTISVLQGSPRGNFPIAFHDEITFSMYADNLFDVQSHGLTAVSPVAIQNPQTSFMDPQPAQAEWAMSIHDSPLVDPAKNIDIYLFASPIASTLAVFLNVINLTRIA
jgi:hypothetical protein